MAEYLDVVRTKDRMCDMYMSCGCSGCPISQYSNGENEHCEAYVKDHPAKAERKITAWGEKNPEKTILDEFLENYPDAPLDQFGAPKACPNTVGYPDLSRVCAGGGTESEDCLGTCCWGQPAKKKR